MPPFILLGFNDGGKAPYLKESGVSGGVLSQKCQGNQIKPIRDDSRRLGLNSRFPHKLNPAKPAHGQVV